MNPYQILGLQQNSSIDDVERAYKKLAFQFHPDRNPGDAESEKKFREIQEAYDRIKKPENFQTENTFGGGFNSPFDIIFPFFNEDPNVTINLTINVQEAYFGINKTIQVPRKTPCSQCMGTKFSEFSTCSTCLGQGAVKRAPNVHIRCRDCHGNGKTGTKKCEKCHFTGHIKENTELSIKLPSGLKDNSILRLQGAGHQFREFVGDLLLKVKIVPCGKYYLVNDELCINIEAPLSTFISGGDIEITDLDNDVIVVKILPQTPSGTKLRVKNKGMLLPNSENRSDLIAIINVQVPNITDINMLVQLKNLGI